MDTSMVGRVILGLGVQLVVAAALVGCGSNVTVSDPAACASSECGPCLAGCVATAQCVDGALQCGCDCANGCGADVCAACAPGCTPIDACVDGHWQCGCDCPPCAPTPCPACPPPCESNGHCEASGWVCECSCPTTIGEAVAPITQITVSINLADGFMDPWLEDVYRIDVTSELVDLNAAVSTTASTEQMDALQALVASLPYRMQPDCMGMAIDGAPWPPTIAVSNTTTNLSVSVSDQSCAETDHSAQGEVVSCSDYSAVTQALLELFPEQGPYPCESYW